MLRILSLGAGVQSSTLALMVANGEIDPVDCAIFADTQSESKAMGLVGRSEKRLYLLPLSF